MIKKVRKLIKKIIEKSSHLYNPLISGYKKQFEIDISDKKGKEWKEGIR